MDLNNLTYNSHLKRAHKFQTESATTSLDFTKQGSKEDLVKHQRSFTMNSNPNKKDIEHTTPALLNQGNETG